MREHYYHEHTDIMLWYCTRCGEGFHFKSNKSKHRNTCPKKNGPEIYQPRAPVDEKLEETFRCKTAIAVTIPLQAQATPEVQPTPEAQPEVQPEEQGQAQEQVVEVEEDDQWETDAVIASIGGETLLEMLAEGQVPGVTDEGDGELENVVKKEEEFDLEMKFDD